MSNVRLSEAAVASDLSRPAGDPGTDRYGAVLREAEGMCQCGRPDCGAKHVDVERCGSSISVVAVPKDPDITLTKALSTGAEVLVLCRACDLDLAAARRRRPDRPVEEQEVLW